MAQSNTQPEKIQQLGTNLYAVNYNVTEVEIEGNIQFNYDVAIFDHIPTYDDLVNALIRTRYSACQELALHRQREEKITEFQEYYDYCESCKVTAREIL